MRFNNPLLIIIVLLTLSGCMLKPDLAVRDDFWKNKNQIVGVAIAKTPQAQAHKEGNQGLLEIAINNANASELEKHLNTLDVSAIDGLAERFTRYLQEEGIKAKRISTPIDLDALPKLDNGEDTEGTIYASHDFRSLKAQYNIDKLVILRIVRIGTVRRYYSFIPTSSPSGTCSLNGQLVNLNNNLLEWNQAVSQTTANASAEWDQPPNYPGLTAAMYTAYEQSRQLLLNSFTR